jgi:hypothetical protein
MTSPAEAGRWIAALGDEVVEVEVEGEPGWLLAADVDAVVASGPRGIVRLLPGFDPYVVAAPRGADAVLPAAERARVYRPQGWLSPVVLADGRITGVWSHEAGDALAVRVEPFRRPAKAVRAAVEAEVERLAALLGLEPALRWSYRGSA